jgi:hypothetical protein
MFNCTTRFLGLAAVATAFVGVSYGQITCAAAPGTNPSLRAEGETELLADFIATCVNAGAATSGSLFLSTSLPITSKAVTLGVTPSNEATVTVTTYTGGAAPAGATVVGVPIQGTVSGTQVSFTLPTIPATPGGGGITAFTLTVQNIRVNASGATVPQVTETGVLSYAFGGASSNASILQNAAQVNNATPVAAGTVPYNAGIVLQSLGATSLVTGGTTNYTACTGNAGIPTVTPPGTSFTVAVKELLGGAFKTNGTAAAGGEGGSYVPGGNAIGTASTATEVQIVLANVPSSATVYVPQAVAAVGGTTLTVINSSNVVSSGLLAGQVGFSPSSGAVTILYSVSAIGSVGAQTFNVPVILSFAANAAAAQSNVTVLTSYAPSGVVTGPATAIPTFAASTATPVNGSKIAVCATTLLFPYVTNATGFETGIAITNATTDNLGTIPGFPSAASPVNGTCTLNFYGNAAQPTATVTPTLGAYTAAAPTVVPVYANILTSMVGSSGFSGYAIASCNFLDGHGFAFITDTTGTFSGTEGYLATVIPANRTENNETSLTLSSVTITPGGGILTIGAAATASVAGSVTGVINNTGN